MGKDKNGVAGSAWPTVFLQAGLYKRSQGRVARQVTFAALAVTIALGTWELQGTLAIYRTIWLQLVLPLAVLAVGVWLSFRLVNLPRFADFLIAVEAEMNKVSWPSRTELLRSALVVIFVIFFMAALLFGYDVIWQTFFTWIGVLHRGS